MFNRSELADVTISIGSITIPAHRLVLCLQSRVFFKALEGSFEEGVTKKLQCEPGKEHAYIRVLSYLYTGNYEEEPSSLLPEEGISIERAEVQPQQTQLT